MYLLQNHVWIYSVMNIQEIELIEAFRRMPAEEAGTLLRVAKSYAAKEAARKPALLRLVRTVQTGNFKGR